MDVTALVESHHLNQRLVQQVLSKYYVRHTQAAQAAAKGRGKSTASSSAAKGAEAMEDFSWAEDGFIRTVQGRTLTALGETRAARGPSTEMRVIVWLTLLAWAVAFGATCVVRASTWLPAVLAGFFMYGLLGIGHNGMHTAHAWWKYLMDLSFFSHTEWTVSHCLSHHHWPNTQVDFEISALEPFIWSLASKAGHKNRYLPLYLWGVLCILVCYACVYLPESTPYLGMQVSDYLTPLPTSHRAPSSSSGASATSSRAFSPSDPRTCCPFWNWRWWCGARATGTSGPCGGSSCTSSPRC